MEQILKFAASSISIGRLLQVHSKNVIPFEHRLNKVTHKTALELGEAKKSKADSEPEVVSLDEIRK
ncbi:hypothetical protein [Secundilactobacillus folii]|uniref:Uncharacterized protein n=1 Tax=Secundilactobacillus folii TaxID=2678357 RepID=A0A7X2XWJ7_9LACO|nr:hypothetical protein [Secundilactobacillus folii]MTV81606.1 hypothetical protein [Secundilactobacillus folii]